MTTSEYLAQFGVTMDQAYAFILAHRDEPAYIFGIAQQNGITNAMLGDIVGYSASDVRGYFNAHGLDAARLDPPAPPALQRLLPDDLSGLTHLVALDPFSSGSLSVGALRDRVIAATNATDYAHTFDPSHFAGAADGFFSPDDLGVTHLGTLPATSATLESLFYGTIVTTLRSVDIGEALQLTAFIGSNGDAISAGDTAAINAFLDLLVSVASDPALFPVVPSSDIADAAVEAGTALVQLVASGASAGLFTGLLENLAGG